MPAIEFDLVPTLIASANMTLSQSDVIAYTGQLSKTIDFMHAAMYVVMFVVFVYMVLSIFKKEENEYYQP